jgi:hypothetical protein
MDAHCDWLFAEYKKAVKRLIKPLEVLHTILSYLSDNTTCSTEKYKEAYADMKNAIYQFNIRFRNIEQKFVDDVGSILFLLSKLAKQCKKQHVWKFNTIVSIFTDDNGGYAIVRNFMQNALHADTKDSFTPGRFLNRYRNSFRTMISELDQMLNLLTNDPIEEPEKNNIKFEDKEVTDFVKLMLKKEIRVAASGGAGAAASGGAGASPRVAASGGAGAATASAALPADSENVKFAKRVIASREIVRPSDNFPNMYTAEDHAKAGQIMAASHAGGRRSRSRRNGKTKKQQRQRQRQRQTSRSRRNRKRT